ncbi:MAG: hybrid sensor histidine kinase/response regulator [Deltaproteobacteria bacterium]|nr:hybrid sensor histidine kinase/response regulator [Deltaproteobacteria bacterium]
MAAELLNKLNTAFSGSTGMIISLISALIAILTYWFYRRQQSDISILHAILRDQIRGQHNYSLNKLKNKRIGQIAQTFFAHNQSQRLNNDQQKTIDEVVKLSARVSENLANVQEVTVEALELIRRQIGADVVATAIIELSAETKKAEIKKICGQSTKALGNSILLAFDRILDNRLREENWHGYQSAKHSLFDFSTFGIGLSYNIEIANQRHKSILWVGLKSDCLGLSHEQKELVQGIIKHAAGLLSAAQKIFEDRKQTEAEKHFLIGLSHDLRSPGATAMLALHSLLEGAEDGRLTSEQIGLLQIINSSLEDQSELIANILDYAKHQQGLLSARKKEIALAPVLENLKQLPELKVDNHDLSIVFPEQVNFTVEFDLLHLKRIIKNLITNAIKYTDQGIITIRCTPLGSQLEIVVSDTGIGVPAGEESHLFGEINRLSNVASRSGSGLGLTICNILAKLNGAKMFYRPVIGGGSTFGIRLTQVNEQPSIGSISAPSLGKVLLLDDDLGFQTAIKRYLNDCSSDVCSATELEQALELFNQYPFDLVISDYHLKNRTSLPLLKKATDSATPIMLITGDTDAPELKSLMDNKKLLISTKPTSRAEFYSLINAIVTIKG